MPTLDWLTRGADEQVAGRVPYRLLEPVAELSAGDPAAENMPIHGDNLDALKALLPFYAGRVKCIYIDPPYNTRSAFDHYDDRLERQPAASCWLPTATDKFYPGFVAELEDGRLLVVEYKGGLTAQTTDTAEKRLIGERWEEKSAGRGLFLIAEKRDPLGRSVYEQLQAKTGMR
jgi:16S rRNA G966 N2-methylase RsmD